MNQNQKRRSSKVQPKARKTPVKRQRATAETGQEYQSAPKRPSTPYIMFMKENRARVVQNNPNASFGEISKILSSEWNNLKSKTKYETLSRQDRDRYKRQMVGFVPNPADKKKKRKRNPNLPKRAKSAYIYFIEANMDRIKRDNPQLKTTEVISQLAASWRRMNKNDKTKYESLAAKDKIRYQNEANV